MSTIMPPSYTISRGIDSKLREYQQECRFLREPLLAHHKGNYGRHNWIEPTRRSKTRYLTFPPLPWEYSRQRLLQQPIPCTFRQYGYTTIDYTSRTHDGSLVSILHEISAHGLSHNANSNKSNPCIFRVHFRLSTATERKIHKKTVHVVPVSQQTLHTPHSSNSCSSYSFSPPWYPALAHTPPIVD